MTHTLSSSISSNISYSTGIREVEKGDFITYLDKLIFQAKSLSYSNPNPVLYNQKSLETSHQMPGKMSLILKSNSSDLQTISLKGTGGTALLELVDIRKLVNIMDFDEMGNKKI